MVIDIDSPNSDGWWLNRLAIELHERRAGVLGARRFSRTTIQPTRIRPGLQLLSDYLAGDPPLREDIHSDWSTPFRQFLRLGRMNIAPKMVSARTNRMGIRDFRTAAANDEQGDVEARKLMRLNRLKLAARQVHDYMIGLGDGYTIVTPPDGTRDWSLITAESPMHCITAEDPATGATVAGLKMFHDRWTGTDWAYLFLPGQVKVARCDAPTSTLFRRHFVLHDRWEWDDDKSDDVPGDKVAMVRFQNKDGRSDIEGHLDTLDRINDKIFNEWWIGKIQAFRQRALEVPDDEDVDGYGDGLGDADDENTPENEDFAGIFTSSPDAMWQIPKGAKIWESQNTDVTPMINSIKAELQFLAFTGSMPLHLITPDAAEGSAEGASTQKEESSFELSDRRDRAEPGWAATLALAFEFAGDTARADVTQIQVVWGPMELHSMQEMSNAASQVKGIVPVEAILTDVLGYEPADVTDRLRTLRGRDLLYTALSAAGDGSPAGSSGSSSGAATVTGNTSAADG